MGSGQTIPCSPACGAPAAFGTSRSCQRPAGSSAAAPQETAAPSAPGFPEENTGSQWEAAAAGLGQQRLPPRPAWRHGIPGRCRQWRRGHGRGHPRQPRGGGAAPSGDLGAGERGGSGSSCGTRTREQPDRAAGSAASSAPPGAGRAKADRDNPWFGNLRAASCGWELVLPSFNFSSCSSWDVCVVWGIDANFDAWLLEFTERLQILLLYNTAQPRLHFLTVQ